MDGSRSFERESVVAALWSARDYARTKEARLLSRLMYSRRKKREKEKGKKRKERGEMWYVWNRIFGYSWFRNIL